MLCAPLVARDGMIGLLKVASRHTGRLTPFDAELVDRFRSQAAVAIQNLTRTESLQARMLTAERKHAMADLARTVSHDVNNALGAMLPLIQQMQADLQAGRMDRAVYLEDLDQVQKSVQACRRIFGGMLSFARGGARRSHHGEVSPALETTLAVLKDGMQRRGIDLVVETVDDLPPVACGQSDLEQVFLNLLTNAREASSQGGQVTVRVEPAAGAHRHHHRRQRLRHRAGGPAAGLRAVLHDQGQRQRPRAVDLPLDPVGDRRHAERPERAAQRDARAGDRPVGAGDRTRAPHHEEARRASSSSTTKPGMVRAVERVLGAAARRRRQPLVAGGARHRPPVRPGSRHPRREDAGDRRLRADGAAESRAARRRHHRHDRQPRRPRSEADSGDPRAAPSTSSRSRSIARCCRRWSSAVSSFAGAASRAGSTSSGSSASWPRRAPSSSGLLPLPDMVIDGIAVSCRYESCAELGGDLCDYVSIGPGRIALLVADVMGHGVSAAMLTGVVKSAFRAASPDGYEPRAMVQRLWSNMEAFGSERFVTLIAAVVSLDERRIDYVNAGHPAGLLVAGAGACPPRRAPARWSPRPSAIARGNSAAFAFEAGDLLFLYTDGVSDALGGDDDAIVAVGSAACGRERISARFDSGARPGAARRPPPAGRSDALEREAVNESGGRASALLRATVPPRTSPTRHTARR